MTWHPIDQERYAIQSTCKQYRISRALRGDKEYFSLWGKASGNWELLANFQTSSEAKMAGEKLIQPKDYYENPER